MIYVTGDMHVEASRFEDKRLKMLKRGDTLIICGDFGFIWDGSSKEKKQLRKLSHRRFNIVFVDGTHENFDLLYRYPVVQWNGGRVHKIASNIFHLCRGETFEIEGKTIFAMGGGESGDVELRKLKGEKYWEQECPAMEEMQLGVDNLYDLNLTVDYIITHEPPSRIKRLLDENCGFNPATAFFDELVKECKFKHWYFGSAHQDKRISSAHTAVYESIIPIDRPGTRY